MCLGEPVRHVLVDRPRRVIRASKARATITSSAGIWVAVDVLVRVPGAHRCVHRGLQPQQVATGLNLWNVVKAYFITPCARGLATIPLRKQVNGAGKLERDKLPVAGCRPKLSASADCQQ